MSPLEIGLLICVVTLLVLATGIPIAFGLGVVSLGFLIAFDGWRSVDLPGPDHVLGSRRFHPRLHPDVRHHGRGRGLVARRRRSLRGAEPLAASGAGLAGHLQSRCLRHLRGPHRLVAGDLRGDRQDGHPRDAAARLSRGSGDRRHRRGRHARHPDPAEPDHDPLRHRLGNLDRPAVPGRRVPRAAANRPVHAVGLLSSHGGAARS